MEEVAPLKRSPLGVGSLEEVTWHTDLAPGHGDPYVGWVATPNFYLDHVFTGIETTVTGQESYSSVHPPTYLSTLISPSTLSIIGSSNHLATQTKPDVHPAFRRYPMYREHCKSISEGKCIHRQGSE